MTKTLRFYQDATQADKRVARYLDCLENHEPQLDYRVTGGFILYPSVRVLTRLEAQHQLIQEGFLRQEARDYLRSLSRR